MFYISLIGGKTFYLLQKMLKKANNDRSGLAALKLDGNFLKKVKKPPIIIAVTGTNGKTTTCNILVDILEHQGYKVACNRGGSNYAAGVATALLKSVNIFNQTKCDYLVAEYDEISSEKILPALKPDYLLVNNLTRDSMRRNAHADYVFERINKGIGEETTLILNANDPISSRLGPKNKRIFFEIDKLPTDTKVNHSIINDMAICPQCQHLLKYDYVRYHHIGKVHCPACDFKTPTGDYLVTKIGKTEMTVKHQDKLEKYALISDSIFNIYNLLGVIALLREMKFSSSVIQNSIKSLKITEIRLKTEKIGNLEIIAHMTKGQNAMATSRVFDYVSGVKGNKEIILMIEDYYDRMDSSETMAWLYDADFEFLKKSDIKRIIVAGVRHQDIVLRLLIAGIPQEKIFSVKNELATVDYLELQNTDKVYILYEIPFVGLANQIMAKIKEVHK